MPFECYFVRKKGTVEVGISSCASCHTRVMADGSVLKGAQGNFPEDHIVGYNYRASVANAKDAAGLSATRERMSVFSTRCPG
jgi:hypothetical protein